MERDKNIKITKSDIHFVAGDSIELDINFNYILATKHDRENGNLSKFIKEAVVGYYESEFKREEDNAFKAELNTLKAELNALKEEIRKGVIVPTTDQVEKIEVINSEIKLAEIKPSKSSKRFLDVEW